MLGHQYASHIVHGLPRAIIPEAVDDFLFELDGLDQVLLLPQRQELFMHSVCLLYHTLLVGSHDFAQSLRNVVALVHQVHQLIGLIGCIIVVDGKVPQVAEVELC